MTQSSHPLPHLLCPYSIHIRNGSEVSLQCTKSNIPKMQCAFIRYCTTDKCIKMIQTYQQKCKYLISQPIEEGETMSKKKNNQENINQENELFEIDNLETSEINETEIIETIEETFDTPITQRKTEMCRILYLKSNVLAFDFKGYGIHISIDDSHILDEKSIPKNFIEVEYESEIGKPDFKYFVKFQ